MKKLNFIIIFCAIFIEIYTDEIKISNSSYPVTLTLNNENIIMITQKEIIFFDPSMAKVLKHHTLNDSEIVKMKEESYKTNIEQYSNEDNNYILASINDNLVIFDKEGEILQVKDFSEILSQYQLYNLTPIKKDNNDLYFIISLTNQTSCEISLFYFKINIINGEHTLSTKNYHPKDILGDNCYEISANIECQIMNSNDKKNIFSCFYMAYSDLSIINYK
jgi:hypothetical protein